MTDGEVSSTLLLPEAHRIIRTILPDEGPYPGLLIRVDSSVAVLSDALVWRGADLWHFCGAEHIAAPTDLVLRDNGTSVVLPWCTQTIDKFLAERELVRRPLEPGEAVTLIISLLRGAGEWLEKDATAPASGEWWLTHESRPVFVIGEGPALLDGVRTLIQHPMVATNDRSLRRAIADIVLDTQEPRRFYRSIARHEHDLLELAAPRPLHSDLYGPETARSAAVPARLFDPVALRDGSIRESSVRHNSWLVQAWTRAHEQFAEWRDARARTAPDSVPAGDVEGEWGPSWSLNEKSQAAPPRRKRVFAVALVVAGTILAVGLLWPTNASTSPPENAPEVIEIDAAETPGTDVLGGDLLSDDSPNAESLNTENPDAETEPPAPASPSFPPRNADPLAAVPALIELASYCWESGDTVCAALVADEGTTAVIAALAARSSSSTSPTLVDDYGDVAAVRLPAESGVEEQIVVVVREENEWRARDVYDVAGPPNNTN
ncbi:hypothetical protein [Microbacterium sp. YY-01]|uniref:hypothetical protein n=1 Tax=Microbacterium sp. YY-01 TaxID=3421634 RepID=UPI003D1648B4